MLLDQEAIGFNAVSFLLEEILAELRARQEPAPVEARLDLGPVVDSLAQVRDALASLPRPEAARLDTSGLEERLDSLLQETKKKGGPIMSAAHSSGVILSDVTGQQAKVVNGALLVNDSAPIQVDGADGTFKNVGYTASDVHMPVDVVDPLPAGTNNIGHVNVDNFPVQQWVRDDEGSYVRSGQLFLAGTGQLSLTAAGNARLTLQNPANSGKTLYVYRLGIYSTSSSFAELLVNPTTGLPASAARPNNNLYIGNPTTAVAVLKGDTNLTTALGGGTDSGVALGFGANVREEIDFNPLMIVPPGVTVGFQIAFTGAATLACTLYWVEA